MVRVVPRPRKNRQAAVPAPCAGDGPAFGARWNPLDQLSTERLPCPLSDFFAAVGDGFSSLVLFAPVLEGSPVFAQREAESLSVQLSQGG